jgi:hypothetical protein
MGGMVAVLNNQAKSLKSVYVKAPAIENKTVWCVTVVASNC